VSHVRESRRFTFVGIPCHRHRTTSDPPWIHGRLSGVVRLRRVGKAHASVAVAAALVVLVACCLSGPVVRADVAVATFRADVTPPLGEPVGLGFVPSLKTKEHPLEARGVVLRDDDAIVVLCAIDWCEVHNRSYAILRKRIAEAAGIRPEQVAVHCLHQHTAPAFDSDAQALQRAADDPRRVATTRFLDAAAGRIARAVGDARTRMRPVTHIGYSRGLVRQAASNRRIRGRDGTITWRGSSTGRNTALRELPEGRVDPWLRTVTFLDGTSTVAQLHYYATHPQSFYSDARASYDVPGIARTRLEKQAGGFQVYFSGCGGDVAFGKYNDGSRQARDRLADRVYDGMKRSVESIRTAPLKKLDWRVLPVAFGTRRDPAFSSDRCRAVLADAAASDSARLKAAVTLAWNQRVARGEKVELSCLVLGPVKILHLPGEPFVHYQLAAQQIDPESFVAVAGFGDCGMSYIGTDEIFTDQGGYEQSWALSGRTEQLLLESIRTLLRPGK